MRLTGNGLTEGTESNKIVAIQEEAIGLEYGFTQSEELDNWILERAMNLRHKTKSQIKEDTSLVRLMNYTYIKNGDTFLAVTHLGSKEEDKMSGKTTLGIGGCYTTTINSVRDLVIGAHKQLSEKLILRRNIRVDSYCFKGFINYRCETNKYLVCVFELSLDNLQNIGVRHPESLAKCMVTLEGVKAEIDKFDDWSRIICTI